MTLYPIVNRQQILLWWERQAGVTSEALANFTNGVKDGTAIAAANNYAVSAGKILRIMAINVTIRGTAATVFNSRVRIRQATSVAANSPIIWAAEVGAPSTTFAAEECYSICYEIADGLHVVAGQQVAMTHLESSATGTVSVAIIGFEYS